MTWFNKAKIVGDVVIFYRNDIGRWFEAYEIPLKEIRSEKGLAEWIEHLNEKTWFTSEHYDDLVELSELDI